MFKTRLETWNFVKNASRKDWYGAALLWRDQEAAGSPLSDILIHGKVKTPADHKRYLREQKPPLTEAEFLEEALQEKLGVPSHVRFAESDVAQMHFDGTLHFPAPSLGIRDEVEPQSVENLLGPCASCHRTNAEIMLRDRNEAPFFVATPSMSLSGPAFHPRHHLDTISEPPSNPRLGHTMEQTYDAAEYFSQMGYPITGPLKIDAKNPDTNLARARKKQKVDGVASEKPDEIHQTHSTIRITDIVPIPLTSVNAQPSENTSGSQSSAGDLDRDESEAASFLAACIYVPTSGAWGRSDALKFGLKQVAASVHTMCFSKDPLLLLTIDTVMVLLRVYAEGTLPQSLLSAIHHAAIGSLGENDPICRCIEWMMAAAGGYLLDCGIDSKTLQSVCNSISQVYGKAHSHSLVAQYSLAFQLLLEGAHAEAEVKLLLLYDVAVEALGPNALLAVNILAGLSRAQTRQGQHQAALDTIDRCLERTPLGTPPGLNHPHRFELLYRKALICKKLGDTVEMLKCFATVVEGRAAALGTAHPSTLKAHKSLEDALRENDMWESHKGEAHRLLHNPQVDLAVQQEP